MEERRFVKLLLTDLYTKTRYYHGTAFGVAVRDSKHNDYETCPFACRWSTLSLYNSAMQKQTEHYEMLIPKGRPAELAQRDPLQKGLRCLGIGAVLAARLLHSFQKRTMLKKA